MDYEIKYKEALENARQFSEHPLLEDSSCIVKYLFPELKESEENRIRKAICIYLDWLDGRNKDYQPKGKYTIRDMIAWLEKQGEHKPANKVEPKFRIGDIIRFKGNETLKGETETHKIVSYNNELYVFDDGTTDLFCEQDLYELVEQKSTDKLVDKGKYNKEYDCAYRDGVNAVLHILKKRLNTLDVKELETWHLQKNEDIYDAVKDWSLHSFICLMDDGSIQKFTGIRGECADGSINIHIDAIDDKYNTNNIIFWIETPL